MSCRGKGPAVCRSLPGCKYASGKKRNFCRKSSRGKAKPKGKCSGKGPAVCRSLSGCKYVSGKKRNYCRSVKKSRMNVGSGLTPVTMRGGGNKKGKPKNKKGCSSKKQTNKQKSRKQRQRK